MFQKKSIFFFQEEMDLFVILNVAIFFNMQYVVYLTSSCVNWTFFGMSGPTIEKL
jgi:hypothetical protein